MATLFERIEDAHRDWIAKQALFFVGTAPLGADGHINVSPKGPIGSLRVLDDHTLAYLDAYGSGTETIAHVRENGRIVVMLCAFDGPPRILRLHGRARVLEAGTPDFDALLARAEFDDPSTQASRRAIGLVDVARGSRSSASWSKTYGITDELTPTPMPAAIAIASTRVPPTGVTSTAASSIAAARPSIPSPAFAAWSAHTM